jgi:hypothetical protein
MDAVPISRDEVKKVKFVRQGHVILYSSTTVLESEEPSLNFWVRSDIKIRT